MKKRILGGLLATMLIVGLMAPAASAAVNGLALFSGTATVGQTWGDGGCPKSGVAAPTGKGLGIGIEDEPTPHVDTPKNYGYELSTTFSYLGTNNSQVLGLYEGDFSVCGFLTSPLNLKDELGIGATCISTKGFHGRGRATAEDASGNLLDLKVYDLNWKAALGGTLVITGSYQAYNPDTKIKKPKFGEIYAIVQAAPALQGTEPPIDCLTNDQNDFTVVGVADLIQIPGEQDKGKYPDPVTNDPKKCPSNTPAGQCVGGRQKP